MSLIDPALEDHRLFQIPMGSDNANAGISVLKSASLKTSPTKSVQSFGSTAGCAVLHHGWDMLSVQTVDVLNFVAKGQQRGDS